MRKIDVGKFSEEFNRCGIVSLSSLLFSIKRSKIEVLAVASDSSHPSIVVWVGSLELITVVLLLTLVGAILSPGGFPEIRALIIQAVLVSMVYLWSSFHDGSVHVNGNPLSVNENATGSIVGILGFAPSSGPIPLHQPFVIGRINHGVHAFSQRNQPHRAVNWLSNRMPFNPVFHSMILSQEVA